MAPAARLLGPLEAAASQLPGSRYVCSTCRRQCLPRPYRIVVHESRRFNSSSKDDLPITEKIRRKIWGTDNPPGLPNPYGEPAFARTKEADERLPPTKQYEAAAPKTPYKPSQRAEGLETVGHLGQWRVFPATPADEFYTFLPTEKLRKHEEILSALHQAAVEVTIMKHLKRPMDRVCYIEKHDEAVQELLDQVLIKPTTDSLSAQLIYPDETIRADLHEYFRTFDEEAEAEIEAATESESRTKPKPKVASNKAVSIPTTGSALASEFNQDQLPDHSDFLSLSLEQDPRFKFAFLKRSSQLIGYRVPDYELSSIPTASRLLDFMLKAAAPPPRKLAKMLLADKELAALPNVHIFTRKQSPFDHDKEIGRLKLIKEELAKRNLPLIGPREPPRRPVQRR